MNPRLDYSAIRQQISIRQVLKLLGYQPVTKGGHQLRGRCPITEHSQHSGQHRCFAVELQRNLFYCFACRRGGNQLDLWMAITNLPLHAATIDLCQQLSIQPATLPITQPPNHTPPNQ